MADEDFEKFHLINFAHEQNFENNFDDISRKSLRYVIIIMKFFCRSIFLENNRINDT